MLISTVCSVAVYCQHCGKIHVYDVPYFFGSKPKVLKCESCGCECAVLKDTADGKIELTIECVGCGKINNKDFSRQKLRKIQLEKIYCSQEHFELGYIGRRQSIEELLEFNKAEFEALLSREK